MEPKTQKTTAIHASRPPFQRLMAALTALLTYLSAIPSIAEVDVNVRQGALEGPVAYVDERSVMHLEDVLVHGAYPHAEEYSIKELSLTIDPDALGVIVTGRRVRCGYSFSSEDYFVGRCSLRIRPSNSISTMPYWPTIRSLALKYGLGIIECTKEELTLDKWRCYEEEWRLYNKKFDE